MKSQEARMVTLTKRRGVLIGGFALALTANATWAQKSYGPEVTDIEIKLG
jgi:hypothetical protein